MLSIEQAQEIKQRIIEHIQKTFPLEQKEKAIEQVEEMDLAQFEAFLEKNKILKEDMEECVFCSIVNGNINSCKIGENKNAIAVLDINPISKGHSIIISKEHNLKSKEELISLSQEISKLLKRKLKPTQVKTKEEVLFGHTIISVLPVYFDENFDSPKKHASLEDLEIIKQELEKKTRKLPSKKRPKLEKIKEKLWLPKRIP